MLFESHLFPDSHLTKVTGKNKYTVSNKFKIFLLRTLLPETEKHYINPQIKNGWENLVVEASIQRA